MEQRTAPRQPQIPLQLILFETQGAADGRYTNTIDLYDIAPRFVFYTDGRSEGGYLKSIRRDFEHGGATYKLLLRPGRLVRADGSEREEFPGEREQIVEAVMQRIASDRARLSVRNEKVRLTFSLYEIREELRKVRHLYSLDEIKDALTVLHTAVVEITRVEGKNQAVLSSSSFPVLALRRKDDQESAYLEFNPLVENAIKNLHYRRINYDWLMRISHPLSRWLYLKLCQGVVDAGGGRGPAVSMTAMEIARDGPMSPRNRQRDTLRYVINAVDVLIREGFLEDLGADGRQVLKEGRRKADVAFDLMPTPRFLDDIRRAEALVADGKERLLEVAGTDFPSRFIDIERGAVHSIKSKRRRLTAVVSWPFLVMFLAMSKCLVVRSPWRLQQWTMLWRHSPARPSGLPRARLRRALRRSATTCQCVLPDVAASRAFRLGGLSDRGGPSRRRQPGRGGGRADLARPHSERDRGVAHFRRDLRRRLAAPEWPAGFTCNRIGPFTDAIGMLGAWCAASGQAAGEVSEVE